jgi:hypothetical protein
MTDAKAEHLAFLKDEDRWPAWPLCPVKKHRDNELEIGCATAGQPVVVLVNMFEFRSDAPKIEYESWEALVEDGWRVD